MLHRVLSIGWACCAGPLLAAAAGCTQDHDLLARDPPSAASTSGSGGGPDATGSGATTTGAGGGAVEPPGPTELTVVNGVSDHDAIRICFLAHPDGTGAGVAPWPSAAAGLEFARAEGVEPLAPTIPEGASVRAHAIAGDLRATEGLDCAEILALAAEPGAPVVAAALPVLPASVFTEERSLLLVATGCLGGEGHTHESEKQACGDAYTIDTPTAGLVAVAMSRRTTFERVGLQVAHASAATPVVDVQLTLGQSGASGLTLAQALSFGAIAPFPPFTGLARDDLGALEQLTVETYDPIEAKVTASVPMDEILANSDVTATSIADGEGFVLVAVGAAPGTARGGFWRALTYTLLRADP
ncbi:hypothetical protein SOCE26_006170 [Sorangium cellulosum]|uniref:Secreted protein n=1 Tax=Sorangium cellulosum TaxID=56 RepID=A0A2L0EIV7_SORCE|nr:hypothetical protein [Sorangium cellulosum]AUX39233.1 hypothetical protein SOCE26_006170 [Sorangium cellulosum]